MTKISSGSTFFKHIFPFLWFGIIGMLVAFIISTDAVDQAPIALLAPLFLTVMGFVICKTLLWDLADEVYDQGDGLFLRKNGHEEIIPLSNIMNVDRSLLINPPRVTLRLVTPGHWGKEVVFSPVVGFRLNPFAGLPVIEDLIERVDQARAKRGS